jgi:cobalt-zinc-cadmium efflux system protein
MSEECVTTGKCLRLVLGLTVVAFVVELIGGYFSNSLALLSDAGHVFTDAFSLTIAYVAFQFAYKPSTRKRTFGYHRGEVFAAALNGVLLVAIALTILYEAYTRINAPMPIRTTEMLVVAVFGLAINLYVVLRLREHGNLNIRSAMLHAASDALSSVGVIIGGVLVAITGETIIDPLVSVIIAGIIFSGAYRVIRTSLHILSESSPYGVTADKVCAVMSSVSGVFEIHDVHTWCVCSDISYLTAHVVVKEKTSIEQTNKIAARVAKELKKKLGVSHVTLQFETGKVRHKKCMTCDVWH